MANTKNTKKVTKTVNTPKTKETKVMKKVETKEVVKKEVKAPAVKENKVKSNIKTMLNSELKELFIQNGCSTHTNANDKSKVVYNTFGTKSRILQQGRGYQLLLTDGHMMKKDQIIDAEYNDTDRFLVWYGKLSDDDKGKVVGADSIKSTKLAISEMPRERSCKITDYDLLVKFIRYMGTFDENKLAATK